LFGIKLIFTFAQNFEREGADKPPFFVLNLDRASPVFLVNGK